MSLTLKTSGNPVEIAFHVTVNNSGTANMLWQIYVDGVATGPQMLTTIASTGYLIANESIIVPMSAGVHKVDLFWQTGAGTSTAYENRRILKVREL
jgi:hypothetical protein